jgi:hypothetical protein
MAPAIIFIVFAILYPVEIRKEEISMKRRFGSEYELYFSNTPRFIPSIKNFKEDQKLLIDVRRYRKGLVGLSYFIAFIAGLGLVDGLHENGILKAFFLIY